MLVLRLMIGSGVYTQMEPTKIAQLDSEYGKKNLK